MFIVPMKLQSGFLLCESSYTSQTFGNHKQVGYVVYSLLIGA